MADASSFHVAAILRTRPKVWAVVMENEPDNRLKNYARSIRTGSDKAFAPAGSFEAVKRAREVYARFIGETPSLEEEAAALMETQLFPTPAG